MDERDWMVLFSAISKIVHTPAPAWRDKRDALVEAAASDPQWEADLLEMLSWFGGNLYPDS